MKHLLSILIFFSFMTVASAKCISGDCVNGYGNFVSESGHNYVGDFKDGVRYGQGTYTWSNGAKYVGGFKNDLMHGQGTLNYAEGNLYVGGWKNGVRYGQGTLTYPNDTQYEGEWNEFEFQGTVTYPDGTQYASTKSKGGKYIDGNKINNKDVKYLDEGDSDMISTYLEIFFIFILLSLIIVGVAYSVGAFDKFKSHKLSPKNTNMKKSYYLFAVLFSLFIGWINHPRDSSMPIIEIGAIALLMLPISILLFYIFHRIANRNKIKKVEPDAELPVSENIKPSKENNTKTAYANEIKEINEVEKLERQIKIKKLQKELKDLEEE